MPETVCVTVEQLRRIERHIGVDGWRHWCPVCGRTIEEGHPADCWLGNAIAQAERLSDWQPKVRDRVRLRAMPEAGTWKVLEISEGSLGMKAWLVSADNKRREMQRYLAELMPEEE